MMIKSSSLVLGLSVLLKFGLAGGKLDEYFEHFHGRMGNRKLDSEKAILATNFLSRFHLNFILTIHLTN